MSYRSDVKLITTKQGWERIKQAVQQAAPDDAAYIIGDSHTTPLGNDRYVLAEWDDIKWYNWHDYFPEVSAVERMLREFDQDGTPYRFTRLGENYEDIERIDNAPYPECADMPSLWVERKIIMEY